MIEIGKKYKKIAKGELKLLTKYFLEGKNIYENWINIKPFQRQLENLGVQSDLLKDELNPGKIYATIELKEPQSDFQKKAALFPSPNNENIQETPKNKFDDNLSDVSISIVETKEEDREGLELDQFIEYEYIEGLKLLLQNDYKNILPKDFVKLKQLNEILYGKFIDLSNAYNETLYSLSSINEEIRQQAKKYYDEYKLLKKDVYNGRIDLKKQNEQLHLEIQNNNQENINIKKDIEKYLSDKRQFKSQLGIVDIDKKTENKNTIDNSILTNILKNLSGMGYDIFKGANLNEEELKLIEKNLNINNNNTANTNINNNQNNTSENNSKKKEKKMDNIEVNEEANNDLEKNLNMNDNNANNNNMNMNVDKNEEDSQERKNEGEEYEYENDEDMKDDLELGNQVVSLIEKDVNDLYLKKVIEQIKIDQINAITYTFENEKDEAHEITLKIVNGELYCIDGTKFSAWLIKNFSS